MVVKLGVFTTHPIQYQVPWFQRLSNVAEIDLTVFFCMLPDARQQGEGFGVDFQWDIPLLEGYKYEVLENVASDPSVTTFRGCDTPGIFSIVARGGFDVFIVNGWVVKSCLQLLWACRKYKVPCIVRGESNSLRPRAWWKRVLHRVLLTRYAAFLNIGRANREFYLQNGVAEEKIFFAPYCIDNERFAKAADLLRAERDEIRRLWGIPSGAVVFLFCGKFIHKKRPMDILDALLLANEVGKENARHAHVLFVGDGELRKKCERVVEENELPVTFAGFLNQGEIIKAYVASDCLALPSDNGETWGLVVNEGMACGLPAIVSDQVGCHPDLLASSQAGAVYPCGDVQALSQLLAKFSNNAEELNVMQNNARKVVSGYSYEKVVQGTLEAVRFVNR